MDLDSEKMVNLESNENTQVNKINPDEIKIENSKKIEFLPSTSFSKLLQGFVLAAANSNSNFQAQFGMSHQEALGTVTAIAAQTLHQSQTQNESLEPSSNPPKSPESDGYNWRKYGQKHVKSSGNSRSYYRCTIPSCCAKKKVQHVDESGKIVEVVYKGNHNHDPPHIVKGLSRKRSFSETSAEKIDDPCREESTQVLLLTYDCQDSQLNSSVAPVQNDGTDVDEQHLKTPETTTRHAIEVSEQPALSMEVEHSKSSNCNAPFLTDTLNERDIPIKKRRLKESNKEGSQPVYRTFKEPKIVVQSAADSGICSDGYRWRKYGQKMVKGNQHPRSYYRCSSAGCPVRKHVERATDDSSAIISMYEGEHDHDKPLPKKQQTSPKSPILVDAPPTDIVIPNNVPLLKTEENSTPPCRESSAQHHEVSNDGCNEQKTASEPASPPKVLESAQTLVSVGIKPEQGIKLESC